MQVKGEMISKDEAQQFGQLRARIESSFLEPAIVVISSAARGDGKSATAFGLAQSLAEADHRVLLIDANTDSPTLSRSQHRPVLGSLVEMSRVTEYAATVTGQRFKGISFADERLESGMSVEKLKLAIADIRSHFDFTVIDTAQLTHSNLAVLFASLAEATMLTVRVGRLGTANDDVTVKTLMRVSANLLGVLTVTPKLIKAFRERVTSTEKEFRYPARHLTTRHSAGPESVRETVEPASRSTVVS